MACTSLRILPDIIDILGRCCPTALDPMLCSSEEHGKHKGPALGKDSLMVQCILTSNADQGMAFNKWRAITNQCVLILRRAVKRVGYSSAGHLNVVSEMLIRNIARCQMTSRDPDP